MPDTRPNILLLMTDQQRGDALGIEGHPVLQTPYLDELATHGIRFRHGYTACPVCIPARRTLMSGQKPSSHGVLMNYNTWLDGPTLPGELSKAGYQTHLVGKLHLWPKRKLYGFDSADWADSPRKDVVMDDYERFLIAEGVTIPRAGTAHGSSVNGWVSRPFHMDERFHFTNWCADSAIRFLERRDPTVPFFLKVSFHQPHQPCTPPQAYWDRYINADLPEPVLGDWARVFDGPQRGLPVASWRTDLLPAEQRQYMAGYFGCINHIDNQIGRILECLPGNTLVVFTSDHGEMLCDHQWIRKRSAYEPSARVPFILNFPKQMGIDQGRVLDHPVELMDIMPTLLDAAGAAIPESVDGASLLPVVRDESAAWREYVHGECSAIPSLHSGMQYLTDGKRKYIWHPGIGQEQYFNLEEDPRELHDLAGDAMFADEIARWRGILIRELEGRPEGFTDGRVLQILGNDTRPCLPGFEPEGEDRNI